MADKSYLNNNSLPRGIRNNNPGNLVRTSIDWEGKVPAYNNPDTRFEQFIALKWGIRALMRDIISDFKKGNDTITSLISEFAPAFENNTGNYIATVAQMVGIGANTEIVTLDKSKLIGLCKAIILVENGAGYSQYIDNNDYEAAYAVLGIDLGGVKKSTAINPAGAIGIAAIVYVGYLLIKKSK